MLFSYNWLKEYAAGLPSPKELSERLTMTGTEIESVTEAGADIKNVITAQVVTVNPHPNADRLSLCEVRTDKEVLSIVCGAKNMKPGDKVPLALPGASLPGGSVIKRSRIRGVESAGMMCSEVELGLKDSAEGLMILPPGTPLGIDIKEALGLSDFMMEAGITPNRADLLSIKGMAREICAITGAQMKDKNWPVKETGRGIGDLVSVSIDKGAPCRRYAARVITGVNIGPSPDFIKKRLEAHGIRPINNVVDMTNYVLLEKGQPMHAFDLGLIQDRTIMVRLAKEGEAIRTIDGKERRLDHSMLVIADAKGPVALAGVMGGRATEVGDSTKDILLESAWFEPASVRRTSKKTVLSTDSSYRFERGVDIEGVVQALDMAAHLINKYAGGAVATGTVDAYPERIKPVSIEFRVKRAEELLGITVKEDEALDIFERLGVGIKWSTNGVLNAMPPSFRGDLKIETDLIEEVARLFGYDNIPTTLPVARLIPGGPGKLSRIRRKAKEVLANSGFFEVINYSFVSRESFSLACAHEKKGVTVLNPLTEEQAVMRDSLLPSLLENLRRNLLRKNEEVRIFEFAPVFHPKGKLPLESWKIAGLMYGLRWDESWNYPKEGFDFFDVKGVIETLFEGIGLSGFTSAPLNIPLFHPGKSASIQVEGREAGVFGEVHPDIRTRFDLKQPAYLFELDIDAIIDLAGGYGMYRALPRFPESTRDLAFIIDEAVAYQEIISSIEQIDTKLIERVEVFDVYCAGNMPPGKRSMALRIVYRAADRTLTHQEVEDIHTRVARELSKNFNAEVRGEVRNS